MDYLVTGGRWDRKGRDLFVTLWKPFLESKKTGKGGRNKSRKHSWVSSYEGELETASKEGESSDTARRRKLKKEKENGG